MIFRRLLGVVLFRSTTYKEIAESANLWAESALLVISLAVANSLAYTLLNGPTSQSVLRLISPPINWALFGYLSTFLIRKLFNAEMPVTRILNVYAYALVPGALGLLLFTMARGVSGSWGAWIVLLLTWLTIIAAIIGIREASQITTLRAILIFAISFIMTSLILSVVGTIIDAP